MKIIVSILMAALFAAACANTGSTVDPTAMQYKRDMNSN